MTTHPDNSELRRIYDRCDISNNQTEDPLGFDEFAQAIQAEIDKARLHERQEIALDNYQGQTFSDDTNWAAKFEKFIENNERRIATLKAKLGEGEGK